MIIESFKKQLLIPFCYISNYFTVFTVSRLSKYLSTNILTIATTKFYTLLINILSRIFCDTKRAVFDDIFNPDISKMYHIKRGGGIHHNKFLLCDYLSVDSNQSLFSNFDFFKKKPEVIL